MTLEQVFIKSASEALERHKLGTISRLLKNIGGLEGIAAASKANTGVLDHLSQSYAALDDPFKARLWGQVIGGGLGGITGAVMTDEDASGLQTLGNVALGTMAGAGAGKYIGKKVNKALTPKGKPSVDGK